MNCAHVCLTIDTESPQTPLYEKRFRDNRIYGSEHGIELICKILRKYNAKATFFLNVYEYVVWGRKVMRDIVKYIHDQGHEVGLHTHPIWIDELRRENMFQFSLEEQIRIIRWGVDFIEQSIGQRPVSHRAGAYGCNHDTMKACSLNGIRVDSSQFFGHQYSRVIKSKNSPFYNNGVLEIPINGIVHPNNTMTKLDIDFMSNNDIINYINIDRSNSEMTIVNIMFHSYSLTNTDDNYKSCKKNLEKEKKLNDLLSVLKINKINIYTVAEIYGKLLDQEGRPCAAVPDFSCAFARSCCAGNA